MGSYIKANSTYISNKLFVKLKLYTHDSMYGVGRLNINHSFSFLVDNDIL